MTRNIALIVGSLRTGSLNRTTARPKLAPETKNEATRKAMQRFINAYAAWVEKILGS